MLLIQRSLLVIQPKLPIRLNFHGENNCHQRHDLMRNEIMKKNKEKNRH